MPLAISNIAWDTSHDANIAELLKRYGVDAIDIAPGKYFPEPAHAASADISALRQWWADRGIEITGMQSLLFGTTGLNLFGEKSSRQAMLVHLAAVCRIAGELGATRLVFGSPRNRDRSGLSGEQVLETAVAFFQKLGDTAADHGVMICLEPNPSRYGANFMTHGEETAKVVRAVDHRAIRMQLDTGAMAINKEDPAQVLKAHSELIGHVHISEPDLLPIGDGETDHHKMRDAIKAYLPQHLLSLEMVATKNEPHVQSVERAIRFATHWYGAAQ